MTVEAIYNQKNMTTNDAHLTKPHSYSESNFNISYYLTTKQSMEHHLSIYFAKTEIKLKGRKNKKLTY